VPKKLDVTISTVTFQVKIVVYLLCYFEKVHFRVEVVIINKLSQVL